MAIRRLYKAFQGFATDPRYLRADAITPPESGALTQPMSYGIAGTFADQAIVLAVAAREGARIQFRGEVLDAQASTDEPLRAGQQVWVTRAASGEYIILGSVR